MAQQLFTENEMKVILSLMRNPEHTDTEISSSMGMNLFTFNKIKNSLLKNGMLSRYYVPNYGRLGFEILCVSSGSGMDNFSLGALKEEVIAKRAGRIPRMSIFGLLEENSGIMFHVLQDFTALKRLLRLKEIVLEPMMEPLRSPDHSFFSFGDLRIERFFDVEQLFSAMIDDNHVPVLEPSTPGQRAGSMRWSDFFDMEGGSSGNGLGEKSYRVLVDLVKYPDIREGDRIERMGISRYRFRKIRDHLFEEGYMKPFYSADLMGMGYEVMIFTHMRFRAGLDPRDLFRRFEDRMSSNLIVIAFDHTEAIGMGIFRNLMEGSRAQSDLRKAMMERDFLAGEPEIRIFSLPNCQFGQPLSFHQPLESSGMEVDPFEMRGL